MAPISRLTLFTRFEAIGASIESVFSRRLNVILFLVGRYLLILGMIATFYLVYLFA